MAARTTAGHATGPTTSTSAEIRESIAKAVPTMDPARVAFETELRPFLDENPDVPWNDARYLLQWFIGFPLDRLQRQLPSPVIEALRIAYPWMTIRRLDALLGIALRLKVDLESQRWA